MEKLEYRMYGIVPYNISPIQQGIQFGHAVQEYNNNMLNRYHSNHSRDKEEFENFQEWARRDKTFMVMNGGTTNRQGGSHYGTLNTMRDELEEIGVRHAWFAEPDLGNQLTAVVWLADERCWDKEKYPDIDDWLGMNNSMIDISWRDSDVRIERKKQWIKFIGGEQNVKLREFISKLKFA